MSIYRQFKFADDSEPDARDKRIAELEEKVRTLSAAVVSSAEANVTAIDRLQLAFPIVEAARRRFHAIERLAAGDTSAERALERADVELTEFVKAYNAVAPRVA